MPPRKRTAKRTAEAARSVTTGAPAAATRRRSDPPAAKTTGTGAPATEAEARKPKEPIRWLVLAYRVPSEPTRLRAAVWRKLKNLGAIYLQGSVAAMPADVRSERAMRTLRNEIIEGMGGRAQLLTSTALVGEADLVAEFNAARDDEYEEILDKCQDFHAEIEKETAAEHFTYGELEEIEEDLEKLRRWHEKVKERDAFRASRAEAVREALEECSAALQGYASLVYQADSAAL